MSLLQSTLILPDQASLTSQSLTGSSVVPGLALSHENLLYQIFSISAFHLLLTTKQGDAELMEAKRRYEGLALREQRSAVEKLGKRNRKGNENGEADAVCFTSVLIFIEAFAALRSRVCEWFRVLLFDIFEVCFGGGSAYQRRV